MACVMDIGVDQVKRAIDGRPEVTVRPNQGR
jgi:hypothetical protein